MQSKKASILCELLSRLLINHSWYPRPSLLTGFYPAFIKANHQVLKNSQVPRYPEFLLAPRSRESSGSTTFSAFSRKALNWFFICESSSGIAPSRYMHKCKLSACLWSSVEYRSSRRSHCWNIEECDSENEKAQQRQQHASIQSVQKSESRGKVGTLAKFTCF